MNLTPSRDIKAEVSFLDFHNNHLTYGPGTYQVVEHDGEINYAVVSKGGAVKWFTEFEYQDTLTELDHVSRDWDKDLFSQQDREELMDSWDTAMVRQEGERLADEISMADDYHYGVGTTVIEADVNVDDRNDYFKVALDHDEFRRVDANTFANSGKIEESPESGSDVTIGQLVRNSLLDNDW